MGLNLSRASFVKFGIEVSGLGIGSVHGSIGFSPSFISAWYVEKVPAESCRGHP